jgi:TPR repeat protein
MDSPAKKTRMIQLRSASVACTVCTICLKELPVAMFTRCCETNHHMACFLCVLKHYITSIESKQYTQCPECKNTWSSQNDNSPDSAFQKTQHVLDAAIRCLTSPSDHSVTALVLATQYVKEFCESNKSDAIQYDISNLAKMAREYWWNKPHPAIASVDMQLKIVTIAATWLNCPESAYWLGLRIENNNKDSENNWKLVSKWYTKAAEQGHTGAQYNLGRCCEDGLGVAKNLETAVEWYTKAAEQGHTGAQYNLGRCCEKGRGAAENLETAVEWYIKAAEQGHVEAQFKAGFLTGNMETAAKWFTKAAEQGCEYSQFNLGNCYMLGKGVTTNLETAVEWLTKAAEGGHIGAKITLDHRSNWPR